LYPDADIRLAISRAIAIEGSRGWKISKEKQTHKIDVVVALGMAALAAAQQGARAPARWWVGNYEGSGRYLGDDDDDAAWAIARINVAGGSAPSSIAKGSDIPNDFVLRRMGLAP